MMPDIKAVGKSPASGTWHEPIFLEFCCQKTHQILTIVWAKSYFEQFSGYSGSGACGNLLAR